MSLEARRQRTHFRTGSDLVMGVFYTLVGGWLVIFRSFGNIDVPAWVAWLLGGMMAVGGIARFYRGLKDVMPGKKEDSR